MKKTAGFLSLIFAASALAQDVPPPAKPTDSGPSLADTMQFIREKLDSIGAVSFVLTSHNSIQGIDGTSKLTFRLGNVKTSAGACRIDFHVTVTNEQGPHDFDPAIPLKSVEEVLVKSWDQSVKESNAAAGHPEESVHSDPPAFTLDVRGKTGSIYQFTMFDESLANRLAKAMVHAIELCGGGNKDPF